MKNFTLLITMLMSMYSAMAQIDLQNGLIGREIAFKKWLFISLNSI